MHEKRSQNHDEVVTLGSSSQEFLNFCKGELERRRNADAGIDAAKLEAAQALVLSKLQILEEEGMA
ncbi:MAG: nodulation protein E [Gammaproteobacteria bacterium]|nr:nodulation protein E [Gammaproteobacteria bacterium]